MPADEPMAPAALERALVDRLPGARPAVDDDVRAALDARGDELGHRLRRRFFFGFVLTESAAFWLPDPPQIQAANDERR